MLTRTKRLRWVATDSGSHLEQWWAPVYFSAHAREMDSPEGKWFAIEVEDQTIEFAKRADGTRPRSGIRGLFSRAHR